MRIKPVNAAVFIISLLLIQTTLLEYSEIAGIKPNLLLVLAVCAGLLTGSSEGAVIGFFAGLAHDLATGTVFGLYALLSAAAGYLTGMINRRLYRDNIIVLIAAVFAASVVFESAVFLLFGWGELLTGSLMGEAAKIGFAVTRIILPEAAYNCLASVPLYYIIIVCCRNRNKNAGKLNAL